MLITVNQRIKHFIDNYLNEKYSNVARELGVSRLTISNIVEENNNPSYNLLRSFAAKYNNINLYWLILGEGEMLRAENPQSEWQQVAIQNGGDVKQSNKIIMETTIRAKDETIAAQKQTIDLLQKRVAELEAQEKK